MLSITKRFCDNDVANEILKKHTNEVLERNVLSYMDKILNTDKKLGECYYSNSIFIPKSTLKDRIETMQTLRGAVRDNVPVILNEEEMFALVKAICLLANNFTVQLKEDFSRKRVLKLTLPWFIKNKNDRSYLSLVLWAENVWDMEIYHYLADECPEGLRKLLLIINDHLLLPYETPYGFVNLIVTKKQFEILEDLGLADYQAVHQDNRYDVVDNDKAPVM